MPKRHLLGVRFFAIIQLIIGLLAIPYFVVQILRAPDIVNIALGILYLNIYMFGYLLGTRFLHLGRNRLPAILFMCIGLAALPINLGLTLYLTEWQTLFNFSVSFLFFLVFVLGAGLKSGLLWTRNISMILVPIILSTATFILVKVLPVSLKATLGAFVPSTKVYYLLVVLAYYVIYLLYFSLPGVTTFYDRKQKIA